MRKEVKLVRGFSPAFVTCCGQPEPGFLWPTCPNPNPNSIHSGALPAVPLFRHRHFLIGGRRRLLSLSWEQPPSLSHFRIHFHQPACLPASSVLVRPARPSTDYSGRLPGPSRHHGPERRLLSGPMAEGFY